MFILRGTQRGEEACGAGLVVAKRVEDAADVAEGGRGVADGQEVRMRANHLVDEGAVGPVDAARREDPLPVGVFEGGVRLDRVEGEQVVPELGGILPRRGLRADLGGEQPREPGEVGGRGGGAVQRIRRFAADFADGEEEQPHGALVAAGKNDVDRRA